MDERESSSWELLLDSLAALGGHLEYTTGQFLDSVYLILNTHRQLVDVIRQVVEIEQDRRTRAEAESQGVGEQGFARLGGGGTKSD